MDPRNQAISKTRDRINRELYRQSNDRIQVHNFLNEPFTVLNDGYRHTVQPNSDQVFPKYVAEMFFSKIIDYAINQEEEKAVTEENAKRVKSRQKPMDPQEREQFDVANGLVTNNEAMRLKYGKLVGWKVVERYGVDQVESDMPSTPDARPIDERLIEQIAGFEATPLNITAEDLADDDEDLPDIEAKKENLAAQIS